MMELDGLSPVEQKAACLAWLVSARRWLVERGRDANEQGFSTLALGELDTLRSGMDEVSVVLANDLRSPGCGATAISHPRLRVIDGGKPA